MGWVCNSGEAVQDCRAVWRSGGIFISIQHVPRSPFYYRPATTTYTGRRLKIDDNDWCRGGVEQVGSLI